MIGRAGPKGRAGLVIRTVAAAVMGTISFYISVVVAYVLADVEMTPAETLQSMFPAREPIIVAIVVVTSALAYLVIAKSGLYRAIVGQGVEGWIAICPVVLFVVIVIRAVAVDLAYFPIHYETDWSPDSYVRAIWTPIFFVPYLIDGILLFGISMLLSKGVGES